MENSDKGQGQGGSGIASRAQHEREGGTSGGEDTVEQGLFVVQTAVDMLNNNMFKDVVSFLKPKSDVCMYHALAYGSVLFMQAGFGMEREMIEKASTMLNKTIGLCNRSRRPRGIIESLSGWMFGQRMDDYSRSELIAEVFYAEANLLLSFLTFVQDENLMSFVSGALRIKICHSFYKQLYHWLQTCQQEGLEVDATFAAGVHMGYGCFNLFLSLLPSRILKVLEFAGFSGNRAVGLEVLAHGAASGTFRAPLCTSFLLFYYTVVAVYTGIHMEAEHAELLLRPQLEKFPRSVQFLYFNGRVAAMKGNIDKAILCFHKAIDSQDEWKQVRHLCWWELSWCHCLKAEWGEAAKYSALLYRRASGPRYVPQLKQHIAGKSLSVEKFVVSKSERFLAGAKLPLCGIELIYSHNAFLLLKENPALLQNLLTQVEQGLAAIEQTQGDNPYYEADWCVASLTKGSILRVLGRYDYAKITLLNVIAKSEKLQQHDKYTIPAANAELGLLLIETGEIEEAEKRLLAARTDYKGYHLENRIQFRIHEAQNRIGSLK